MQGADRFLDSLNSSHFSTGNSAKPHNTELLGPTTIPRQLKPSSLPTIQLMARVDSTTKPVKSKRALLGTYPPKEALERGPHKAAGHEGRFSAQFYLQLGGPRALLNHHFWRML